MTSPDLTPYADLSLFDRSAEEIFQMWLTQVVSRMPEYQPLETNTEVVIAEALALEVSEEVFAINRLPAATIEGVLRLFGVARDPGAAPLATLTFHLGDTAGHTIPAGSRAVLQLAGGLMPVVFATTGELVIAPGADTGTISAVGDRLTADANGAATGTILELLDSISFVETVRLASQPVDGADAESAQAWLSRGVARFARLSQTVTLPEQFEDFALEQGIYRAHAVDLYDPTFPTASPGDHPGHITLAVYGKSDLPIPEVTKTELLAALDPVSAPHLVKHVINPTLTSVAVSATVVHRTGYTAEAVAAACEAAVREWLHPDNWPWSKIVRRTQLITLLASVEGVAFVASLPTPASDVMLPGVAALTRAGTIGISVVPEGSI